MSGPSDNSEASKASEEGERPEAEGAKAPGAETAPGGGRHGVYGYLRRIENKLDLILAILVPGPEERVSD